MSCDANCIKPFLNYFLPKEVPFKQDFNKAIDELKSGIYIDSLRYGPENIITNQNYF